MTNKWIEHVKAYAKNNNMSYSCALACADCKKSYNKSKSQIQEDHEKEKNKEMIRFVIRKFIKIYKKEGKTDEIQQKFNQFPKITKDYLEQNYKTIYEDLSK